MNRSEILRWQREDAQRARLLRAIPEAVEGVSRAEMQLRVVVDAARRAGWSWGSIGEVLGVSRQSAHERFARKEGMPPIAEPEPMEPEAVKPRDEVAARRARSGLEGRRRKRRKSRR